MSVPKPPFDYFVIVAGMRTGSNVLEERLNEHPGVTGLGELFNPHFFGRPKQDTVLGFSRAERNHDPLQVVAALAALPGTLAGFRLFDGHDGRVLDHVLSDPRCAKILLTRNPLDSYVSLKIARETKQWWMGNVRSKKTARVAFDGDEFRVFLAQAGAFQDHIRRTLQVAGQAAFQMNYAEVNNPDILDGLVRFLGLPAVSRKAASKAKVQNPGPVEEKITNPDALPAALARIDPFDLGRIPDFEPARGAGAGGIQIARHARLAFLPVGSVATAEVSAWLTDVNNGRPAERGLTQRELKAWFRRTPGHRSFAVVDHPADRAYAAFRRQVLTGGTSRNGPLRSILVRDFGMQHDLSETDTIDDIRRGFLVFLDYVKATLSGQTGHRIDPDWASQVALLQGVARLRMPDVILRRADLAGGLDAVGQGVGLTGPQVKNTPPDTGFDDLYDRRVEAACRSTYRKDYAFLGFADRSA